AWWDAFRQSLQAVRTPLWAQCLVTGRYSPVTAVHPRIRGLASVGGAATGSVLVSFDKPAFSSYGLTQGANAPMQQTAVASYSQALEDLIEKAPVVGPLKVIHWFDEALDAAEDPFKRLETGAAPPKGEVWHRARGELNAWSGFTPPGQTANRFHAVLMMGVSSRVMVRGWYEGTFAAANENIAQWQADMAIVSAQGKEVVAPALWQVAADISDAFREPSAVLVTALWESAVLGAPVSVQLAWAALHRIRQSIQNAHLRPTYAYSLLKGYILREDAMETEKRRMSQSLDLERLDLPYQLGRLFAVFTRLQQEAAGETEVVDRYYQAASTTPAVVFGRLHGMARKNLGLIGAPPEKIVWEQEIMSIMMRIAEFPLTLNLKDQSVFALGYYHQLAEYRRQFM
ncbi:MAG: type I-C CRISPR-associated protein Cas8c/Csd1, partial [Firmicutes bacterium]|nr:type I-C CRISPR-associated protein Cas8c/Csd1 [Bacillota bacterium]